MKRIASAALGCLLAASCHKPPAMPNARRDIHSYSNPDQVQVRDVDLDIEVLFDRKILKGSATLTLERREPGAPSLILDTRDLRIEKVEQSPEDGAYTEARFTLGAADPILGAPLTITLAPSAGKVRIWYSTSPQASALQWLDPPQTAGKKQPFLFTQSQAIHARSWIPLQDSPGVRQTYSARVRTPKELRAVMSARNDPDAPRSGEYRFRQRLPIPSYLMALAVGDLDFRPMGARTGVYAEPAVVERAAKEFDDTEKMLQTAQQLYGPYRWGRYDLLVLPPSFPFGGMENPSLTFATPTVLAGDKSLVSLVAHELAHSWSGNLVTNATWSDFWLNEGFTVYVERRILEKVYGRPREEMEAVLGKQELEREMAKLPPQDQILHIDLKGRDPDDGATSVPYEKGALFLRSLEQSYGREKFDAFLRGYFTHFAFQSITTGIFLDYLQKHLLNGATSIPIDEWLYKPGLPASAPQPVSDALTKVEAQAKRWTAGEPASKIETAGWTTQEWLRFLTSLPQGVSAERMRELDHAFSFTKTGNSEILEQWLLMAVKNRYAPAYPRLEAFLETVGRRKYLRAMYEELVKTPEGRVRAEAIYKKARPGYHPIAVTTIDGILATPKTAQ
jgi:leukotriene-A4 hydrolase